MERGMLGNWHVPCGAGEKLEITSNAYLLPTINEFREGYRELLLQQLFKCSQERTYAYRNCIGFVSCNLFYMGWCSSIYNW